MRRAFFVIATLSLAALSGCDWMPGRPKLEDVRPEPHHITSFEVLYSQNCRGCHGDGPTVGGSISMNNPLYLALIPKEQMHKVIAEGIPGTNMSAFALEHGGSLTDEQVEILVNGIYAWAKEPAPTGLPPYSAPLGNAAQGAQVFGASCASCHGADGHGVDGKAGSVVNHAYLNLVSDQYLRTIVLVGRPELGCPDFQNRIPGRAMTNEEISDVVAWLVSQRKNEFGQPVPLSQR